MRYTDAARQEIRRKCHVTVPFFEQPTPAATFRQMAEWCEANQLEHDVYGEGALISQFEGKIAALLGKPAAAFMPSGVMAQLIALKIWADTTGIQRFGMHPASHLAIHEQEAYQALLALHGVPVGHRLRPIVAADIANVKQALACLLVELPIREAGGQLPSWDELDALKNEAQQRNLPLHLDGARLWESRAYYGKTHAEIVAGFDSVYVSMYKGIGGIAGAVLAGEADFIANARLWQRRMGGMLVHQSPMIVSAAMQFDERLRQMDACYARTLTLATTLSAIAGIRINPTTPHTNMLHLYFDAGIEALTDARDQLAVDTGYWLIGGIRPSDVPGWSMTELNVGGNLLALTDIDMATRFADLMARAKP